MKNEALFQAESILRDAMLTAQMEAMRRKDLRTVDRLYRAYNAMYRVQEGRNDTTYKG